MNYEIEIYDIFLNNFETINSTIIKVYLRDYAFKQMKNIICIFKLETTDINIRINYYDNITIT
jgi:hypothetical protein